VARRNFSEIEVVTPNFHRRFSGVTASVLALLLVQEEGMPIAAIGPGLPAEAPQIGWPDLLLRGWRPPSRRSVRIWHARRNNEMLCGLMLAKVLRQPWKLLFTSAAQRRHTALTRFLIRRMDAVIATSQQAASYLQPLSRVIMHGVDTERFHPADDKAFTWQAAGLPGNFGIGVLGRIRHKKGTDLFVEAMCRLLPRHPEWTAVIIGLAKSEERAFVGQLHSMLASNGLEQRVLFLGELPAEELPLWIRRLSIVVCPARWEGFGLVPLEAMASGTPVVAARAGAAADLVLDGATGRLVSADDLDDLTAAISSMMAMSVSERSEIGAAGRAHVVEHHAIEDEAAAICEVYEELFARAGGRVGAA
jgi:mannosyltransferase